MSTADGPELSVILPLDRTSTGAETIEALRPQAGEVAMELVLVGIDDRALEPPREGGDFAAVALLTSPGKALPDARRAGVQVATAPYVAFAETHSFPQPGWARSLVDRLDEGRWAGVGPAVEPGNPARRAVALTLFDYGRWMAGPSGPWPDLPGHNTAYRRDALLAALDRFPAGLEAETLMHHRMREAGDELYLEMRARVRHMNMEHYRACAGEWLGFSRVYAARRGADWGRLRRLVYAAGSPLLPLIRLPRMMVAARRGGYLRGLLGGIDILAVALTASAAGECLGYFTRRCDPSATLVFELHRRRWSPSAP